MSDEKQKLTDNYRVAYMASLEVRKDFAQKEGYVRKKDGIELSLQQAKKAFGEFKPENHKAMERNDNNGKGVEITLEGGEKLKIPNQLALYNEVVKYNRQHGGFYDLDAIRKKSPQDAERLETVNSNLQSAKKAFLNGPHGLSKEMAYDELKDIEKATRESERKESKTVDQEKVDSPSDNKSEDDQVNYDEAVLDKQDDGYELDEEEYTNQTSRPHDDPNYSVNPDDKAISKKLPEFIRVGKLSSDIYYWKHQTEIEAFRDRGSKITTKSSSDKIVKSVVDLASEKEWSTINVKGTDEFKKAVWLEARQRGFEVKGYKPTPQDWQLLGEILREKRELEGPRPAPGSDKKEPENEVIRKESKDSNNTSYVKSAANNALDAAVEAAKDTFIPGHKESKQEADSVAAAVADSAVHRAARQGAVNKLVVDEMRNDGVNQVEGEPNKAPSRVDAEHSKIKDRLLQAERTPEQKDFDQRVDTAIEQKVKQHQTAVAEDERLSPGASKEKSDKATNLKNAFEGMKRSDALKEHPELEPLYKLKYAASTFANKKIKSDANRGKFVDAVIDQAIEHMADGKTLKASKVTEIAQPAQAPQQDLSAGIAR